MAALEIRQLTVEFPLRQGSRLRAVDHVDIDVGRGEIVGLVGESGSGKTVLALSILGLLPAPGQIVSGEVDWRGVNLLNLPARDLRRIRGAEISLIFQNPQSALNPIYTIGRQMVAALRLHSDLSRVAAKAEAVRLLRAVRVPDAQGRLASYPHELSVGQAQRVVIAMSISSRPQLLIADEPTAALDVTIQARILDLLLDLRDDLGMSILLISHDLGVVARLCDRVAVMRLGQIVEFDVADRIYTSPRHPYTRELLASIPLPDPQLRGTRSGVVRALDELVTETRR